MAATNRRASAPSNPDSPGRPLATPPHALRSAARGRVRAALAAAAAGTLVDGSPVRRWQGGRRDRPRRVVVAPLCVRVRRGCAARPARADATPAARPRTVQGPEEKVQPKVCPRNGGRLASPLLPVPSLAVPHRRAPPLREPLFKVHRPARVQIDGPFSSHSHPTVRISPVHTRHRHRHRLPQPSAHPSRKTARILLGTKPLCFPRHA